MPIILIGINWEKSSVAGTCFSAVEQPLAPGALGAPKRIPTRGARTRWRKRWRH